ncbi:MAG: glycosyltransferase family 2 protein [Patescibacteria group bacterium]|nr:glycosyltransferase family 2 protein [Patescibacteria group bacterium]
MGINKKLSIIIPVLNEESTIEEIIKQVKNAPVFDYEKEIIIVDDGSSDNTKNILKNIKEKYNLIILRHNKNIGKGKAIRTGLKAVTGSAVIIQDADLEYNPQDWTLLLKELNGSEIGAVYGSRNINSKKRGYFHYVLGVKFLTFLNNFLFRTKLTDIYTCYKLFPAHLIKSIKLDSNGFEIEAEITAKILKKGLLIKEVPISYNPRKFKQGKKIRFKDGLIGIWTIIKYRFKE